MRSGWDWVWRSAWALVAGGLALAAVVGVMPTPDYLPTAELEASEEIRRVRVATLLVDAAMLGLVIGSFRIRALERLALFIAITGFVPPAVEGYCRSVGYYGEIMDKIPHVGLDVLVRAVVLVVAVSCVLPSCLRPAPREGLVPAAFDPA